MRAAVFTSFTGPDAIEMQDPDDPTPEAGEALLRIEACSLNRHDLKILAEGHGIGVEDPPFVSGVDVAGVVESVGPDVESVEPGDRVVRCPNVACGTCRYCREGPENLCAHFSLAHGGLAEQVVVPADRLVALPDGLDAARAATLPVGYMTAYHMMRRADVGPDDLVFVPGAAGSVGVAAVDLLGAVGARSIATSSSAEKLDRLAALGADHTIQSDDVEAIREAVEDIGEVDAVLNHLSGPYTQLGLDLMRRGGTMAICGQTAGAEVTIDTRWMYVNHKSIVGSTMGTQGDLETVVGLAENGKLDPVVGETYDLDEVADAFRDLRDRRSFGSLVIEP